MMFYLFTDKRAIYGPVVANKFSDAIKLMTGCDDLRDIDKDVLRDLIDDVDKHILCKRVQGLMDVVIVGNAHDDRNCWSLAHHVVANKSGLYTLSDRLAALWKMNQLTGCDDPVNEVALRHYLSQCSE